MDIPKNIVTPKGIAKFPKLRTPDTKFNPLGDFSTKLVLSPEAAQPLIDQVEEIDEAWWNECVKNAKTAKDKKALRRLNKCYTEEVNKEGEETGQIEFNFKRKAQVQAKKTGKIHNFTVALYDAGGQPLPKDIDPWGGSEIKVSAEPVVYNTAIAGVGVALRLKAVQVIELRSGDGASAESHGFAAEEGYTAPAQTAEEPESDFVQEDEGVDKDF